MASDANKTAMSTKILLAVVQCAMMHAVGAISCAAGTSNSSSDGSCVVCPLGKFKTHAGDRARLESQSGARR